MKSKFTLEEKASIIHRYESGESVTSLAHTHGISRGTIYNWMHIAHEDNPSVEKPTNIHLMSRKLQRMSDILEIKNRVPCTSSAPLQERLCALEALYGQYNVHVLCEALSVDRGTFYNHVKRSKKGNNAYIKREVKMTCLVQQVYEKSHQIYGAATLGETCTDFEIFWQLINMVKI